MESSSSESGNNYEQLWQDYLQSVPAGSNMKVARSDKLERRRAYNKRPDVKEKRREYERRPNVRLKRWMKNSIPEIKERRKMYAKSPDVKSRRKIVASRRRQASAVALELLKKGLWDQEGKHYAMQKNFIIEDQKNVLFSNRWAGTIKVPLPEGVPFNPEDPIYDPKKHVDYTKNIKDLIESFKEKGQLPSLNVKEKVEQSEKDNANDNNGSSNYSSDSDRESNDSSMESSAETNQ